MTAAERELVTLHFALTLQQVRQMTRTEELCIRDRIADQTYVTARELGVWPDVLALLNRVPP